MTDTIDLSPYQEALRNIDPVVRSGAIRELTGLVVESDGPRAAVGDFCEIRTHSGRNIRTQVIGFRDGRVLSMPLEETDGLHAGDPIVARGDQAKVAVGPALLGRVLDGFGLPIDDGPPIVAEDRYSLYRTPPSPLERDHIVDQLSTGIRVIDGLLPCGKGQRMGIFGGSGVGKSTLLGVMSQRSSADVNVIALIGERNREVREFLEHELGPEGMKRSVIVVATSDRPAPVRVRACFVALAIAEYFRDKGKDVLMVLDSATRLAMAQREIGLAAGEPPSQKGYTPSVFNLFPRLFERAGNFPRGSITGFFTVLVEGDDFNEPVCDTVRGLLDGHIVLSRELGAAGHYPAIDVLSSVSRLQSKITGREQQAATRSMREALAAYQHSQDLIQLGAYVSGTNPRLDRSIQFRSEIMNFLRQDSHIDSPIADTVATMNDIAAKLEARE